MAEDAARHADHRPRLGRGLAALLGDAGDEAPAGGRGGARKAPIEFLHPNPRNPRKAFPEDELDELAASIRERGVIQPVLVRPIPRVADAYEIIAGERRWRAAQRAGLHEIPILVVEAGDREALEIAIVENVQRADLNALEEANGYAQLAADYGYAHADIARIVGKSRSHIANTMRLTQLPDHSRALLASRRDFRRSCARPARRRRPGRGRRPHRRAGPHRARRRAPGRTGRTVAARRRQGGQARRRRYARARGKARPRAGRQGDDPPFRRERRDAASRSTISSSSTTSAAG